MATDKIDMSLDEIIKQTKGNRRGRGRGLRGNQRGNRGGRGRRGATSTVTSTPGRGNFRSQRFRNSGSRAYSRSGFRGKSRGVLRGGVQQRGWQQQQVFTQRQIEGIWQHDLFEGGAKISNSAEGKLLISNLDYGVNDSDIQELFTEFGQLRKAAVHYDFSGRSLGTAEVIFSTQTAALKAMKQYNTVPLDGRPMKIQLVSDTVSQGTTQRRGGNRSGRGRAGFGDRLGRVPSNRGGFGSPNSQNRRGGMQGQRRGRGRGRGGRSRGGQGTTVTREQLDAQLDQYNKMDIN